MSHEQDDAGTLTEQRESLQALRDHEQRVETLRDRERDLEVDCMAAESSLKRRRPERAAHLSPAVAASIGEALHDLESESEQQRRLAERLEAHANSTAGDRARLGDAINALEEWIEAPNKKTRESPLLRWIGIIVVLAVAYLGLRVHYALWILLIPIAGAMSVVSFTGQDSQWKRLGAKKQFERLGLPAPARWDDAAVGSCLRELRAELDTLERQLAELAGQHDAEAAELQQVAAETVLAERLQKVSLSVLDVEADNDLRKWLLAAYQMQQTRRELLDTQARIKDAQAEAGDVRERLYWFASRRGKAPQDGHVTLASLEVALEQIERES